MIGMSDPVSCSQNKIKACMSWVSWGRLSWWLFVVRNLWLSETKQAFWHQLYTISSAKEEGVSDSDVHGKYLVTTRGHYEAWDWTVSLHHLRLTSKHTNRSPWFGVSFFCRRYEYCGSPKSDNFQAFLFSMSDCFIDTKNWMTKTGHK